MGPNDVQVGFSKMRPKLDASSQKMYETITIGEDGQRLKVPVVREVVEGFGFRIMHVDMLGRIAARLAQMSMQEAVPGIAGWIDPSNLNPPDPAKARKLAHKLRKLEAEARARSSSATSPVERQRELKDAVYFEAAAFCHEAWLK